MLTYVKIKIISGHLLGNYMLLLLVIILFYLFIFLTVEQIQSNRYLIINNKNRILSQIKFQILKVEVFFHIYVIRLRAWDSQIILTRSNWLWQAGLYFWYQSFLPACKFEILKVTHQIIKELRIILIDWVIYAIFLSICRHRYIW